jgi:hypothetical protein
MVMTVLVYGMLELASLVTLCWVLSSKLRISVVTQLAFLVEKQWGGVQSKLVFWVLYASQTPLDHYGACAFAPVDSIPILIVLCVVFCRRLRLLVPIPVVEEHLNMTRECIERL